MFLQNRERKRTVSDTQKEILYQDLVNFLLNLFLLLLHVVVDGQIMLTFSLKFLVDRMITDLKLLQVVKLKFLVLACPA